VSLYVTDRFCYKEVKNNEIIKGIARDRAVVSVHRECRYVKGSVQASFTVQLIYNMAFNKKKTAR